MFLGEDANPGLVENEAAQGTDDGLEEGADGVFAVHLGRVPVDHIDAPGVKEGEDDEDRGGGPDEAQAKAEELVGSARGDGGEEPGIEAEAEAFEDEGDAAGNREVNEKGACRDREAGRRFQGLGGGHADGGSGEENQQPAGRGPKDFAKAVSAPVARPDQEDGSHQNIDGGDRHGTSPAGGQPRGAGVPWVGFSERWRG